MKTEQRTWTAASGWEPASPGSLGSSAQLALAFGATSVLKDPQRFQEIKAAYPHAHIMGCSTSGEIAGTNVADDSLVTTAVHFEDTQLKTAHIKMDNMEESFQAGEKLASALDHTGLVHIFVISDGLKVNGSELVKGLTKNLPPSVAVTGGLAGDGP